MKTLLALSSLMVFSSFVLLLLSIVSYIKSKISTDDEQGQQHLKQAKQCILAFFFCFFVGKGLKLILYDIMATV